MRYKPPKIGNKPQYVPIVVKNRDWLVGYVNGIKMIESLIIDSLNDNGVEIDLRGLDLCLDSSRFNDVMENGKRESNCTEEELKEYYQQIIQSKIDIIEDEHPDNSEDVFGGCFLEVECVCGLGIYTFDTSDDVPEESFKCQNCGRTIIDYTDVDDNKFDYDGDIESRIDIISDELKKRNEEGEDEDED